ncbi:MAG: hypothetical protein WBK96_02265 [Candidatus Manganitrophaceae bacterium]
MNQTKHGHPHNGGQNQEEGPLRRPYWRRVHHYWYFWVAMFLMLVAIFNFVITEELSWWPRNQPQPPLSRSDGK